MIGHPTLSTDQPHGVLPTSVIVIAHRRISLGAVPMPLAGLDLHDIAHVDFMLFMLRRNHAGACGHDRT